jgi:PAS domain S-box-containing protein
MYFVIDTYCSTIQAIYSSFVPVSKPRQYTRIYMEMLEMPSEDAYTDVLKEVHTLRQRVAELEQQAQGDMFRTLLEAAPDAIIIVDTTGHITLVNTQAEKLFNYQRAELIGQSIEMLVPRRYRHQHPEHRAHYAEDAKVRPMGSNLDLFGCRKDESEFPVEISLSPLATQQGSFTICIIRDITERKQTEQALQQSRLQIIHAQEALLRELSTPLIPLSDEILIMPLIGAVDTGRAQQVLETLLQGVAQNHARVAVLDITGVSVVDTQVADALLRVAQAVRLLGAHVVLTGIRPEIAQTLVSLGVSMQGITTCGSLQSGIAYAMSANNN